MTGKEALQIVANMSLADAKTHERETDDATLKIVAGWRVNEPEAFAEIATLAGVVMLNHKKYGKKPDA
jgi:hypothetical protein